MRTNEQLAALSQATATRLAEWRASASAAASRAASGAGASSPPSSSPTGRFALPLPATARGLLAGGAAQLRRTASSAVRGMSGYIPLSGSAGANPTWGRLYDMYASAVASTTSAETGPESDSGHGNGGGARPLLVDELEMFWHFVGEMQRDRSNMLFSSALYDGDAALIQDAEMIAGCEEVVASEEINETKSDS